MASWKNIPNLAELDIGYISFPSDCRKFFAIDESGSTRSFTFKRERQFVEAVRRGHKHPEDRFSKWDSNCQHPQKDINSLEWDSIHQGTRPTCILDIGPASDHIRSSDVWFLLTDGECYNEEVYELVEKSYTSEILPVPLVFVICGSRGRTPESTDLSIGISFLESSRDTLILFKENETGRLFVIAAKGCFKPLGGSFTGKDLTSWSDLPTFSEDTAFLERCSELNIKIVKAESRNNLPKGMSLGPNWEKAHDGPALVDLDALLTAGRLADDDIYNLFAEEALAQLTAAYRTRKQLPRLRDLVETQKLRQVTPTLQDISGAAAIISYMENSDITETKRKELQERLRNAHAKNRLHYQKQVAEFESSPEQSRIQERNARVGTALRIISRIENQGFTADMLSRGSDRARRAERVPYETSLSLANLNFDGPSYKGFCLVCCGEDEVMSITLKETEASNSDINTMDVALDYPLAPDNSTDNIDIISSQNVCFQCALLGPGGLTIYKETVKGIIPTLHYEGSNKKYIDEQLHLSLTQGLQTGASEVAQLFMAILDRTLKTKSWAGAGMDAANMSVDEVHDTAQRKETFGWFLDQLLQNTLTRETFQEGGDWVTFPKALKWIAQDAENNSITSFMMIYPCDGFLNLLSLGERAGVFSPDAVQRLKITRVLREILLTYLLTSVWPVDSQRCHKFLNLVYREFNAAGIPKALPGTESLVTDVDEFWSRLNDCIGARYGLLEDWSECFKQKLLRKAQLLTFWMIYRQKYRATICNFYRRFMVKEHMAAAVFNSNLSVPTSELNFTLLSLFPRRVEATGAEASDLHNVETELIPFRTPFGPSVLRCGFERCNVEFAPGHSSILDRLDAVRAGRREHLIQAFGVRDQFNNSTGMPMRSQSEANSTHWNMHRMIVEAWIDSSQERRRQVVSNEEAKNEFAAKVRERACHQGRGNVFSGTMEDQVRRTLPSFFAVLGQALRLQEGDDSDIAVYQHDWTDNSFIRKAEYELRAAEEA